jgi:hypothetical protein
MLCSTAVTFSAIHSALYSGIQVFISRGASVLGVYWNTIGTPSTSNSSISSETKRVGAIRPVAPAGMRWPNPYVTKPCWPEGSSRPYW